MGKHRFKLLAFVFVLIAAAGVVFLSQKMQKTESESFTPAIAEAEEKPQLTSVSSPDGKMVLTMKKEKVENGTKFSFSLEESESGINYDLYARTVLTEGSFSVPANTFSPDNKYVFLKEETVGKVNYIVFSIDQSPDFPIVFSDLFNEKYDGYTITDATGWGGVNLIVFNTDKVEGGTGPSFWFEVPSKAFIQLSNRFD
jgi:hypothetical protein